MSRVLVIGCGGVASVAIQKCCQVDEVFTEMCIASRTKEKCDALVEKLKGKTKTVLTTAKVDADDVDQLIELINSYKPDLVMNIALPYQDLTIMDACLACGVNYMDTANYERKILTIRSGVQFMKNAAKKKDFLHTLIIPGSGHIVKNSKMQDLQHFLDVDLTRVLHRLTVPMH